MKKRSLLSLFDHSGQWSQPYRDAGWTVVQIDIKHGQDVMKFDYNQHQRFDGMDGRSKA